MKNSLGLSPLPRHNISGALQRLIKSFAQLFALQRREEEEDDEDVVQMEIGFPTDVQHVTHIGFDGSNKITTMSNWGGAAEFLSLPTLTLDELELAMAARSDANVADESLEHDY